MKSPRVRNLAEELRVYRAKKRLSQADLGALVGVSATMISQIERGLEPSEDLLAKIEKLLEEK